MHEKYQLREIDPDSYHFTSDQGNLYHVYFTPNYQNDMVRLYSDLPQVTVYEIYFVELKKGPTSELDPKIGPTICQLIFDFLELHLQSIVFYITNRDDGRSYELFRVYKLWFRAYLRDNLGDKKILKLNRSIETSYYVEAYCCCIMFEKDFLAIDSESCFDTILSEIYPNFDIKKI